MRPGLPTSGQQHSDEELAEFILAGDTEAYALLVRRYQDVLFRHAVGMVRDHDAAADLVQDSFINAYRRLSKCRDLSKIRIWLLQILRNRCLDYLKERRRKDVSLDDQPDAIVGTIDTQLDLNRWKLRNVLEGALAKLPEAQREAFLLKHVEGLSYEEMAEVVGASVSALRMRVLRARELLQAILTG